jgi:UDP-N-acetylglucosamine 2-epimerase (non-hydrolysing)
MLRVFAIEPDVDLALMRPEQDLCDLAGVALTSLGAVMRRQRPDAVLVQGDTTTAFCASLAAFYERIPVAHVEAGLRTFDPSRPFPEEINRRLITTVARWHFAPTAGTAGNLTREGVEPGAIEITGNTVVDALLGIAGRPSNIHTLPGLPTQSDARRILVTLHRRETFGEPQRRLCRMLARVAERPDVEIVFPVHPNPRVRRSVHEILGSSANVGLISPVDYVTFVHLMKSADLIVTDSGGVQEEAPSLNVPIIVMRDRTERPEGVAAGCALLSGVDPVAVERDIMRLLDEPELHARMAAAPNPFGDGRAAVRVVARLVHDLTGRAQSVARGRAQVR